jgi:hypothetical protein
MDNEHNYKLLLHEAENLKKLAFFGVLISTVATLTAAVAIPMLYSYSINVGSALQEELRFCTHRTQTLLGEFDKVK